jgi:biotin carboxylase
MEHVPHILLIGGSDAVLGKLPGQPMRVTYAQRAAAITQLSRSCVGRTIAVDYTDSDTMLAIADRLHADDPLDGVISVDEYALNVAAIIGEVLGITGCGRDAVRMSRNKNEMRERLHSCGIDSTRFRLCKDIEDAKDFAAEARNGVVLKPADGAGGQGVCAAGSVAEIPEAWQFAKNAAKTSEIMIEDWIYGQEYSVETVTVNRRHVVVAVTKKTTSGLPYFVEIGHAASGELTPHPISLLVGTVCAALDAIGVEVGPCHTEAIVGGDGVAIVEINTRIGGAFIWELVELATGIDLFRSSLTSLIGAGIDPPTDSRGAAIAFMSSTEPGLIKAVHGTDTASAMPGVIRIDRIPANGTMVYPLSGRTHRLGYVIAVGMTADEARIRARNAADSVQLDVATLPKASTLPVTS